MRITFVLPQLRMGGGTGSTIEVANRLKDKGHEVTVVYPWTRFLSGSKWYNFTYLLGISWEYIRGLAGGRYIKSQAEGATHGIWKPFSTIRGGGAEYQLDIRANVLRVPTLAEKYIPKGDIIVATWWANAHEISGYGADKGEKFHFIRHYEIWGGPEKLVNKTYTLPLHKLVTSTWLKELMEDKFGVKTLGPVPNGVNFNLFYRERNDFSCHSPKRVGMCYRRQKWKGMGDGLRAFLSAKKKFPEIQLVLFGVNITPEDIKIIKTIDDIEYHKMPTGDELRKIYNSLDIFVLPSLCEGFGKPPTEAMACGVACVLTDVGAVRDYAVPDETALISPAGDVQLLSGNLIRLLEDEETRQKIAHNGYEHIKRFTWDRTVDELERIFKGILYKGST